MSADKEDGYGGVIKLNKVCYSTMGMEQVICMNQTTVGHSWRSSLANLSMLALRKN